MTEHDVQLPWRAGDVAATAGDLPLVKATCRCGYVGKSRRPERYRCGYCYYTAWANGIDEQVDELRARGTKLENKADECRAKAAAFKKRHPEAGGVT